MTTVPFVKKSTFVLSLLVFVVFYLHVSVGESTAAQASQYQELIDKSSTVAKSYMTDPHLNWFRNNVRHARAIYIIPELEKKGFFLTFTGGNGVMLARNTRKGQWSYPAFYTLGNVSLNLQFGNARSEIILMVMTLKGLKAILQGECKLGKDVTISAGPIGLPINTQADDVDILFFRRSINSSADLSVDKTILAARNNWNQIYYGKPVDPDDILLRDAVNNESADTLRQILSTASKQ